MFQKIFGWFADWLFTFDVVESVPPATMMGREAVELHNVGFTSPFLVVSRPVSGSGGYAFESVSIFENLSPPSINRSGWFEDPGYAGAQPYYSPCRRLNNHLLLATYEAAVTRVRVYHSAPPAYAGELQPGGEVRGALVWGSEYVVLVTKDGHVANYRCLPPTATTGNPLVSQGVTDLLGRLGVTEVFLAVPFGTTEVFAECRSGNNRYLAWFANGVEYWQTNPLPDGRPLIGRITGGAGWGSNQVVWFTGDNGFFRIYYFPGTGPKWSLLKCVLSDGSLEDFYAFADGLVSWDVTTKGAPYDGVSPFWIITSREPAGKVRALRVVVDVPAQTYKVTETWTRDVVLRDVAWLHVTDGTLKHVELAKDGTVRLVERVSWLQRLFSFLR